MAIVNGYATLAEVKARLSITDTADDAILEAIIEAVSRSIDATTGRRFWKDASAVTRALTAEFTDLLYVPDLVSITTLKTDENGDRTYEVTWATTDYDTEPEGGIVGGITGWPITAIRARADSSSQQRSFPRDRRAVEISGIWGWNAIPDAINEAALIQSARLHKRKDAPFGVAGSGEFGQTTFIARLDPDVKILVAPFVKGPMAATRG